jgi:SpoVK/Ycf46/Vps4 family AAA+-type ATPase
MMTKKKKETASITYQGVKQDLIWIVNPFDFSGDINAKHMYFSIHKDVPNYWEIDGLDVKKIYELLQDDYKKQIIKKTVKRDTKKDGTEKLDGAIFIFNSGFVLEIESKMMYVAYGDQNKLEVEQLVAKYDELRDKVDKHFYMIVQEMNELQKKGIPLKPFDLNLSTHYEESFIPMNEKVQTLLAKEQESGLFLFHGKPGTGKSTYIKYLMHHVDKDFIFLPARIASNLDDFALTNFLMENHNIILVIEEAEQLIVSRNGQRNSAISMLLNLTDGILGESLGIQIIATFNTDISQIDTALMRKGRLKVMYEFNKLSVEKSNDLLKAISSELSTNEPMTLAEIYNYQDEMYESNFNHKPVGFSAKNK